jgi:hypothetical protein
MFENGPQIKRHFIDQRHMPAAGGGYGGSKGFVTDSNVRAILKEKRNEKHGK